LKKNKLTGMNGLTEVHVKSFTSFITKEVQCEASVTS
jgi:hypothetical protein